MSGEQFKRKQFSKFPTPDSLCFKQIEFNGPIEEKTLAFFTTTVSVDGLEKKKKKGNLKYLGQI